MLSRIYPASNDAATSQAFNAPQGASRKRCRLRYSKCSQCRIDKKKVFSWTSTHQYIRRLRSKCEPSERQWPQRCDRCIEKDFPCSENVSLSRKKRRSLEPHQSREEISGGKDRLDIRPDASSGTTQQIPNDDVRLEPAPHLPTHRSSRRENPPSPFSRQQTAGSPNPPRSPFGITVRQIASTAPEPEISTNTKEPILLADHDRETDCHREFATHMSVGRTSVNVALHCGIDINKADSVGDTALGRAARRGEEEAVYALIAAGADVTRSDQYGYTPLHIAARSGHHRIVELLLNAKADPNVCNAIERTPLSEAVMSGHCLIIKLLVSHNANMEKVITRYTRWTPLYFAVQQTIAPRNSPEVSKTLLELGANPNCTDAQGVAALMSAVNPPNPHLVSLLLQYHAEVDLQNPLGETALHRAVLYCCDSKNWDLEHARKIKVLRCLIQAGASTSIVDEYGQSPLDLLREDGHEELASELQALREEVLQGKHSIDIHAPSDLSKSRGNSQYAQVVEVDDSSDSDGHENHQTQADGSSDSEDEYD